MNERESISESYYCKRIVVQNPEHQPFYVYHCVVLIKNEDDCEDYFTSNRMAWDFFVNNGMDISYEDFCDLYLGEKIEA